MCSSRGRWLNAEYPIDFKLHEFRLSSLRSECRSSQNSEFSIRSNLFPLRLRNSSLGRIELFDLGAISTPRKAIWLSSNISWVSKSKCRKGWKKELFRSKFHFQLFRINNDLKYCKPRKPKIIENYQYLCNLEQKYIIILSWWIISIWEFVFDHTFRINLF